MQELLEAACGLSYIGDIRVGLAEDAQKVRRIVAGSFRQLQELYRPTMQVRLFSLWRRNSCPQCSSCLQQF